MHLTTRMEQFSLAYVRAVATVADCTVDKPSVDLESVDLVLSSTMTGLVGSPRLEIQVKCTALPRGIDQLSFDLKKKNYDDLRHVNVLVPRILVVLVIPENLAEWVAHSEDGLTLKNCAYWISLVGHPENTNTQSVRVHLPRRQIFDARTVQGLMSIVAGGGRP